MGPDVSTLEIGLMSIRDSDCDRVEDLANAVVWRDLEVKTYFVPEERIGEVPLRRPPKKRGLLRVVEVDGFDYSACGGTHVRRTGEIGLIKLGGIEKIRGNLRFDFLCGGRALRDYRAKDRTARKLSASFSCAAADVTGQVEKLSAESKAFKKRTRNLAERLAAFEGQEIIRGATGRVIAGLLDDRTPEEARLLALNIVSRGDFAVVYGAGGEGQVRLILARSETLKADLRQLIPVVAASVPVKGGGGPSLVELVLGDKGKLREAVDTAAAWLMENT
jgi:alanyl-tRNA synthetase